MFLRTLGQQSTGMSPQLIYRKLQTPIRVLKDPRLFVVQMMKAVPALNGDLVTFVRNAATDWNIRIREDHASATKTPDTPNNNPQQEIRHQQVHGIWRLSKLFTDDTFTAFSAPPQTVPSAESLPAEAVVPSIKT